MKKTVQIAFRIGVFIILTILTQLGGIIYLLSLFVSKKLSFQNRLSKAVVFIGLYLLFTFLLIPNLAPFFGREKVRNTENIKSSNYMTVLLNRNYVRPELNDLLEQVAKDLSKTRIQIHYLDANFPFVNNFPLLPHLSHNDGKKIDLSLIYETPNGVISKHQKSVSGYGFFEEPEAGEYNQIEKCLGKGYFQYDYAKYITMGRINSDLVYSNKGTKELMRSLLKNKNLGKIFIEPHLKKRMKLNHRKIRYHGCGAVRHDDHIHIQLK